MVDSRFSMGSRVRVLENVSVSAALHGRRGRVAVPPSEDYPDDVSVTLDGDDVPKLFAVTDLSPHEDEMAAALRLLWKSPDFTDGEKGVVRWRFGMSRAYENALFNMLNAAADTVDVNRARSLFPGEYAALIHWRVAVVNSETSPFMKRLRGIGLERLP